MLKSWKKIVLTTLVAAMAVTGCTSGKTSDGQSKDAESEIKVPTDPVTLKLYAITSLTQIEYQKFYEEPIKAKYPHINIVRLEGSLDKLIAGGDIPDIILTDNDWFMPIVDVNLQWDMTDLVKKFKIDLNKFIPGAIQAIRNLDPEGKALYGIPIGRNVGALFYNKDIFDKFGVPYPKDDMLWSEVLDLARRLTRKENDVQYIGWDPRFPDHIASPYTQPFVDPKTNKALIDTPLYRRILELFVANYSIPGVVSGKSYAYAAATFMEQKRLAMMADWVSKILTQLLDADESTVPNWDMVTNPTFEDRRGMGRHMLANMLVITKTSTHKEQAMQVIDLLTSREHQLFMTRFSRIPALNDPDMVKEYGMENPKLRTKNVAALFKNPASPTPPPHRYDKEVQELIRNMRAELALNKKDINTVLRETQEKADKLLAELMSQ